MVPGRLKNLRMMHKKTQQEIAKILGITRQGYGNYENGITEPDHSTLLKLAEIFNTSTDYLMGRTDSPEPKRFTYEDLDEEERKFIEQLREVANEYGVELTDPAFLKAFEAALDFAKRVRGVEDQRD